MTKIAAAALFAALSFPLALSAAQASDGLSAHQVELSAAKRKKPKYSRAHCLKLNPEKARLYGICREHLR